MQIENIALKDLKPYERNPRRNDQAVDAVAASIREFGFKVPIIIDADNVIVCGHTRYKAAKQLGLKEVPCIKAEDLTPEQIRAFRLVDNKTSELSGWDFAALEEELDVLAEDFDMGAFGFEGGGVEEGCLDSLFTPAPQSEKEPKKVKCPHCGEWFEP